MLEEYRELYQAAAQSIPNYKDLSQIELAEGYAAGGPLSEAYLAALVLRYWNIPVKLANKDRGLYDPKEAYDWYINSLLYILRDKPWQDKNSSIYKDPKAIEKMLNTCVKCDRANWFQASNRQKRKINHGTSSLEGLSDEYSDSFLPTELTLAAPEMPLYEDLVLHYYSKQQYLMALMIDVIVHDAKLENVNNDRSLIVAIKKSIRSLPPDYSKIFAKTYGLDKDKVESSFKYIYNMNDSKLRQSIEDYIHRLRNILSEGN